MNNFTYYVASKHFYCKGKYTRMNKVMEHVVNGATLNVYPATPGVFENLLFSWVRTADTPAELERRHAMATKIESYKNAKVKYKPSIRSA